MPSTEPHPFNVFRLMDAGETAHPNPDGTPRLIVGFGNDLCDIRLIEVSARFVIFCTLTWTDHELRFDHAASSMMLRGSAASDNYISGGSRTSTLAAPPKIRPPPINHKNDFLPIRFAANHVAGCVQSPL